MLRRTNRFVPLSRNEQAWAWEHSSAASGKCSLTLSGSLMRLCLLLEVECKSRNDETFHLLLS
jgi:hypothetical protein